jgi:hypothetical protein
MKKREERRTKGLKNIINIKIIYFSVYTHSGNLFRFFHTINVTYP